MNPRKLTPSMSLLTAFEASGRHLSFTRAAEELGLTQSAVSRQVQALEQTLGLNLLVRHGRQIELTAVGALYLRELAAGLGRIRSATLQALAHESGQGSLHLAVLPTFGSKWLMSRLADFHAQHPGIMIHLHSRIAPPDFNASDLDAAICAGSGTAPWPDLRAHALQAEQFVVIASPATVPSAQHATPADILAYPLLSITTRPEAWSEWFDKHGLEHRRMRMGPSFELTGHLIQAVTAGLGVGLVPQVLVTEELASGQLVQLFEPVQSRRNYFLVYPARNEHLPSLQTFRNWLLQDFAAPETAQPGHAQGTPAT